MLEPLIDKFAQIEDPRCDWRVEHKLLDILVIAVCAVIGEAESFEDIALYGRCKRDWLGRFLKLPGGIPSRRSSGSRWAESAVEPTKSTNIIVSWRRSACGPAEAGDGLS